LSALFVRLGTKKGITGKFRKRWGNVKETR